MPPTEDQFELALAEAILGMKGSGREVLIDDLVSRIRSSRNPDATKEVVLDSDVLVVAVKPVELLACRIAFDMLDTEPIRAGTDSAEFWMSTMNGTRYIVTSVGEAGTVEASVFMSGVRDIVSSELAVLVGMAVGNSDEGIELGGVVVGTTVWDYQLARLAAEGHRSQAKPYTSKYKKTHLTGSLRNLSAWSRSLREELLLARDHPEVADFRINFDQLGEMRPSVDVGNIISGGWLFEDGSFPFFASSIPGKVLAGDMESAGFAAACDSASLPWLVSRGIADFGEPGRQKHLQLQATFLAACFVRDRIVPRLGLA